MLKTTRRTVLAGAAAALPRFAIAQADTRPALTIAVQKIANTGTLEPLREQSSNASEHYLNAMLETPIARNQQHWLERTPGLAESWRRIDDRTVELTLRPRVKYHDGGILTAEDIAWNFGSDRMFGPTLPPDIPAVARRHWPALDRVEATGPHTVRFVNRTPDVTMEGRLSAGGSEIVNPRSFKTPWTDYARAPGGTGPYKLREFRPDISLILDAHDDYWGGRPPFRSIRFLEVGEAAARVNGLLSGEYDLACDVLPDQIAGIEATGTWSAAAPCRTTASSTSICITLPWPTRACGWPWRRPWMGARSSTACGRGAPPCHRACNSHSTGPCWWMDGPCRRPTRRRPARC